MDDDTCPTTGKSADNGDYDHCLACSGEACFLCGAGCWSQVRNCEHDVIDRHTEDDS